MPSKEAKAAYRIRNREVLKEKSRQRYQNNRERWYEYEIISNYGVDLEFYKAKLAEQNGACAICGGQNKNGWRLGVDHDHKTGQIRGLLCRRCNTLLGLIDDDIEKLVNMIDYLRGYGK